MTPQNPNQPNPERGASKPASASPRVDADDASSTTPNKNRSNDSPGGRESGPRFDDRPITRRETGGPDSVKGTKERADEKPGPGPGLPDYGDQEPGDPRHIEIESRESGGSRRSDRPAGGARS